MATERAIQNARQGQKHIVLTGIKTWFCAGAFLLAMGVVSETNRATAGDFTFFENKIRPILAQQCYACHDQTMSAGGLRLDALPDSPSDRVLALLQQRDTAGHPEVSFTVQEREAIRAWIAQGAPWPAARPDQGRKMPMADYVSEMQASHWAFKPVAPPTTPEGADASSPIDAYIQDRLSGTRLSPATPATRRELIRRAYYDLLGLPPSAAAIADFEADPAADAFDAVVEGLLASPHFGERWGRHWLDVARYSDTKGSSFVADRLFPFSHTYRDYVIRAFNEDLPYDQFIRHQLAADKMALGEDKRPLAALGFLTLGKSFGANVHDRIDDRIDVVTRGLQGLTVNCARCHDHKFDPIPTADYYSLYGVFRSSVEPAELPLIEAPDTSAPAYQDYSEGLAKVEAAREDLLDTLHMELLRHARDSVGAYLTGVAAHWDDADNSGLNAYAKEHDLRPALLLRWRDFLKDERRVEEPVFGIWRAAVTLEAFAEQFEGLREAQKEAGANGALTRYLEDHPPATMAALSAAYGALFAEVDQTWQDVLSARLQQAAHASDSVLPKALNDARQEALRQVLYGVESPVNVPRSQVNGMSTTADRNRIYQRQQAIELFKNSHPGRPNRAMALADAATPFDPYVFKRGDATSKGEAVPRQFLAVLASDEREPFRDGSGRLELAEAIASRDNPLTARVFVNRVWGQLFDQPLVGTPSDFGTQGEAPSHPELLDYLAWQFMEDGWSTKSLIRRIMASDSYQQASDIRADGAAIDPENKLFWRQNRRRLGFEAMRDSLLAAADNIDLRVGGYPTNITEVPFTNRRTVYAEVDRHALPSMFRIFDFATPNEHTPMRFETTVPQQALYLMNSPFVVEQARLTASREDVQATPEGPERVRALYNAVLKRPPSEKEVALGALFVKGQDIAARQAQAPRDTTWRYGYGVVNEATGRVEGFTEFPHWTGEAFQESEEMPGESLGMAMLNRLGGHPGGPGHAVVRRWTSEADSLLSCVGELFHHSSAGDGIRAYIISSRGGILWQGDVQDGVIATVMDDVEVRVGDTVDLVVSCRDDEEEDAFRWHPRLYLSGENAAQFETQDWITRFDFMGPPPAPPEPLKPWEQYAQVLLMSNEFMFVD